MNRIIFSGEQIIQILDEVRRGMRTIPEVCAAHRISELTFWRLWMRFNEWSVPEMLAYKALRKENRRLVRRIEAMQSVSVN